MKSQDSKREKIFVAMSGGVDSSVAATLLKKQGYDVTGVFMKPWQPNSDGFCLWKEDREDAMKAASVLGIPLLTWDFSKQYKKSVTDYMIREYRAGRTPNPDVMCNKEIKFGLFLKMALKEGADYIATGHYVRLMRKTLNSKLETLNKSKTQNSKKIENLDIENSLKIGNCVKQRGCHATLRCKLKIAKDTNKDQSYFLWTLKQEQLKHCLFPIGDLTKPEVRKLAKKFGLPNHAKKDSQGVCFIGPLEMKGFLKDYITSKKGKIIHVNGKILGEHDGASYYTIGQRHGLNLGGTGPYYVVSKDIKKNIVYVGNEKDLFEKNTQVSQISWTNPEKLRLGASGGVKFPVEFKVRMRYRAPLRRAVLSKDGKLRLIDSERAITEGQSVVFYRGSEMLGGGIIN